LNEYLSSTKFDLIFKQNKNIPREEEKDLSENEPISNDMINYTRIFSLSVYLKFVERYILYFFIL